MYHRLKMSEFSQSIKKLKYKLLHEYDTILESSCVSLHCITLLCLVFVVGVNVKWKYIMCLRWEAWVLNLSRVWVDEWSPSFSHRCAFVQNKGTHNGSITQVESLLRPTGDGHVWMCVNQWIWSRGLLTGCGLFTKTYFGLKRVLNECLPPLICWCPARSALRAILWRRWHGRKCYHNMYIRQPCVFFLCCMSLGRWRLKNKYHKCIIVIMENVMLKIVEVILSPSSTVKVFHYERILHCSSYNQWV